MPSIVICKRGILASGDMLESWYAGITATASVTEEHRIRLANGEIFDSPSGTGSIRPMRCSTPWESDYAQYGRAYLAKDMRRHNHMPPHISLKLPHLDSNQDKGFQRPVCCHYTMGERR